MQPAAAGPALGIDLGGTKIEAAVLGGPGAGNTVLWRERVATPAGSYAGTLQAVVGLVGRARAALATPGAQAPAALSIGIGTPGSLGADGLMRNCNSTCLNGQPLQRDLQALLGQPVAMANDANCLALSEATDGAGAGAGVVFAVILGTGAGAGIATHGRVLDGPNGLAGEWGHNPLPWLQAADDPLPACYCGRHGCVETYVSGTGLAADHLRATGQAFSGQQVANAAAAGDPAAQATLQRHLQRLGRALAGIVNVLDPDVIVLGGGLSRMPHLAAQLPAAMAPWVFHGGGPGRPRPVLATRVLRAQHGDASGVRGAAWLGRQLASRSAQQGR
jgi:fructokinase